MIVTKYGHGLPSAANDNIHSNNAIWNPGMPMMTMPAAIAMGVPGPCANAEMDCSTVALLLNPSRLMIATGNMLANTNKQAEVIVQANQAWTDKIEPFASREPQRVQ